MPQSQFSCTVHAIDHLVLTVKSIPVTKDFYEAVLGMRSEAFQVADGSHRWALIFGQSKINLHQAGKEFEPKAKTPTSGSADLCFLTDIGLDVWTAHLNKTCTPIEEGPAHRTGATGPIQSIYIRDPDGNLIEIAQPIDQTAA